MEMAMKLLEKDVHEKQDTMVTLRAQLEDIKAINLELVTKLAECEKSLTYKTNLIQRLEMKSVAMADTLQQLDAKFVESERSCVQVIFSSLSRAPSMTGFSTNATCVTTPPTGQQILQLIGRRNT